MHGCDWAITIRVASEVLHETWNKLGQHKAIATRTESELYSSSFFYKSIWKLSIHSEDSVRFDTKWLYLTLRYSSHRQNSCYFRGIFSGIQKMYLEQISSSGEKKKKHSRVSVFDLKKYVKTRPRKMYNNVQLLYKNIQLGVQPSERLPPLRSLFKGPPLEHITARYRTKGFK